MSNFIVLADGQHVNKITSLATHPVVSERRVDSVQPRQLLVTARQPTITLRIRQNVELTYLHVLKRSKNVKANRQKRTASSAVLPAPMREDAYPWCREKPTSYYGNVVLFADNVWSSDPRNIIPQLQFPSPTRTVLSRIDQLKCACCGWCVVHKALLVVTGFRAPCCPIQKIKWTCKH